MGIDAGAHLRDRRIGNSSLILVINYQIPIFPILQEIFWREDWPLLYVAW